MLKISNGKENGRQHRRGEKSSRSSKSPRTPVAPYMAVGLCTVVYGIDRPSARRLGQHRAALEGREEGLTLICGSGVLVEWEIDVLQLPLAFNLKHDRVTRFKLAHCGTQLFSRLDRELVKPVNDVSSVETARQRIDIK